MIYSHIVCVIFFFFVNYEGRPTLFLNGLQWSSNNSFSFIKAVQNFVCCTVFMTLIIHGGEMIQITRLLFSLSAFTWFHCFYFQLFFPFFSKHPISEFQNKDFSSLLASFSVIKAKFKKKHYLANRTKNLRDCISSS